MVESIKVTASSVEGMDDLSVSREQATATGENNPKPQQKGKSKPTLDTEAAIKPSLCFPVERQRENLLYKEDLGFVSMRKDSRYVLH